MGDNTIDVSMSDLHTEGREENANRTVNSTDVETHRSTLLRTVIQWEHYSQLDILLLCLVVVFCAYRYMRLHLMYILPLVVYFGYAPCFVVQWNVRTQQC